MCERTKQAGPVPWEMWLHGAAVVLAVAILCSVSVSPDGQGFRSVNSQISLACLLGTELKNLPIYYSGICLNVNSLPLVFKEDNEFNKF